MWHTQILPCSTLFCSIFQEQGGTHCCWATALRIIQSSPLTHQLWTSYTQTKTYRLLHAWNVAPRTSNNCAARTHLQSPPMLSLNPGLGSFNRPQRMIYFFIFLRPIVLGGLVLALSRRPKKSMSGWSVRQEYFPLLCKLSTAAGPWWLLRNSSKYFSSKTLGPSSLMSISSAVWSAGIESVKQ